MRDKQGKLWARIKKEKIFEFSNRGIIHCEMCNGLHRDKPEGLILDFAHSKKRRKIETVEELGQVALLCRVCHNRIEILPQDEMYREVVGIIKRREGINSLFD